MYFLHLDISFPKSKLGKFLPYFLPMNLFAKTILLMNSWTFITGFKHCLHLYLEPGNILSLRWFYVETEELILPTRVKMILSIRRVTPMISTPIMFLTFAWGEKSAWHVVAAESPADSTVLKARIRSQQQL